MKIHIDSSTVNTLSVGYIAVAAALYLLGVVFQSSGMVRFAEYGVTAFFFHVLLSAALMTIDKSKNEQ